MKNHTLSFTLPALSLALALMPACGNNSRAPAGDGHDHGPGGEHAPSEHDAHGGAVIELGTRSVAGFELLATRDEDPIVAGGEAAIDLTITSAPDAPPTAVRFWIGAEDARGSVKALAEIEDPAEPNRWHTHVEVPNPLPEDSRIWIELETAAGEFVVTSFDLNG